MARSLYDRGSLATHVVTTRKEVRQLKLYVDALLAELLEILESRTLQHRPPNNSLKLTRRAGP